SVDQLQYVEKYFMQRAGANNGNLSTLEGVYTSVLYGSPKSDPNSTLWSSGSTEYRWNSGLDKNGDGRITAGEAAGAVRGRVDGNSDEGGTAIAGNRSGKPSGNGPVDTTGANPAGIHNVVRGDTLWDIAIGNGIRPSSLIAANTQFKNPDLIFPGQ